MGLGGHLRLVAHGFLRLTQAILVVLGRMEKRPRSQAPALRLAMARPSTKVGGRLNLPRTSGISVMLECPGLRS